MNPVQRRLSALALTIVLVALPFAGKVGSLEVTPVEPTGSAALTVVVQTIRSAIPSDVSISDDTGEVVAGAQLSDGESLSVPGLPPGSYTITESPPVSSRASGIECSNGQASATNTLDVQLDAGTEVTCTITNDPQTSRFLEVSVLVDWNGAQPAPEQAFEICIRGPSYPNGDEAGACQMAVARNGQPLFGYDGGDIVAWYQLESGDYTIMQTDPGDDWRVEVRHDNPVPIPGPAVIPGEPASARFVNTYSSPVVTTTTASAPTTTPLRPDLPPTGSSGTLVMVMVAALLLVVGTVLAAPHGRS